MQLFFCKKKYVKKYSRNTRINATISCVFFYGVKVYTKYTRLYRFVKKYTRNTCINAAIFLPMFTGQLC